MSALGNRRSFLGGMAAVFAATPVIAAVPGATPLPIIEAPELLAIGDQLPGLVDAFRRALSNAASARGANTAPRLPEL